MSVKITIPNTSSDYLTFGSANTPDAAKIGGYEDSTGNGHLELYTTASGTSTERMRIDASGNVGIGTSSPSSYGLSVYKASGSSGSRYSSGANNFEITINGTDAYISNGSAGPVQIWTNGSERMRIDSSGNVLVGTTSTFTVAGLGAKSYTYNNANAWISVYQNPNASPFGVAVSYSGAAPNGTSNQFIWCEDNAAVRFNVRSNGGIANYSANNVNLSDRREKINFAPADSYLDKICSIQVQTFNYIDQNLEEDAGKTLGVVAQDVQAIAPELVSESNWGSEEEPKMRLSIYQTDFQYALMKCIQELKAELDTVKSELATLKGTV